MTSFHTGHPSITNDNSITIESMTGSAIQLNSPGAHQTVNATVNVADVRTAIAELEAAIEGTAVPRIAEIRADVDTIKAQLAKPSPLTPILVEAARSIRNITERVVAGILSPPTIAAVTALGKATGAF